MFGTLLESRARRERGGKGAVVSIVVHAVLIVLAVAATATARPGPEEPDPEVRIYVPTPKPPAPPPPVDETPSSGPVAPEAVGRAPVLVPPIDVPTRIPDIDLSAPETNEREFEQGARRLGERPAGAPDAGTTANPLFPFQVDREVLPAGGCSPRFPDVLRSANVEGEVLAQFVVDQQGRVVDGSFKALKSTHELFTQAVRACLPALKFLPADADGRKVSQLVQQPFVFALERQ